MHQNEVLSAFLQMQAGGLHGCIAELWEELVRMGYKPDEGWSGATGAFSGVRPFIYHGLFDTIDGEFPSTTKNQFGRQVIHVRDDAHFVVAQIAACQGTDPRNVQGADDNRWRPASSMPAEVILPGPPFPAAAVPNDWNLRVHVSNSDRGWYEEPIPGADFLTNEDLPLYLPVPILIPKNSTIDLNLEYTTNVGDSYDEVSVAFIGWKIEEFLK